MEKKREYIICSAIRRKEPRDITFGSSELNLIEIGLRHHDILIRFEGMVSKKLSDQGFLTSRGRFVDRITAMQIAYTSGQVSKEVALNSNKEWKKLLSEDLY